MQISPDKISEVLERTDLVELVSRNVKLRRSGGNYVGLCPFHSERTGSFNVNPQRRMFKCFGCDAAGDAIAFVQKLNGLTFLEAVRQLAQEVGVQLDEQKDPASELRSRLFNVAATAQRAFEKCLWNDSRGQPGREHLERRGVTPQLAQLFGLGYAPPSWDELTRILKREGILEEAFQLGLVGMRQNSGGYFDTFRGRLTIPIRSPEGRNIAFGGRHIESMDGGFQRQSGGKEPKYLNTKESPLYRKFDTLYGLDMAREEIRKSKSAIVVEGYFDVIGLYSAGVRNVVALCSTALTQGHLTALDRLGATSIWMLLDGDEAGFGAVRRLAGMLLGSGKTIHVATLPTGLDPDEFAHEQGPEKLQNFLETSPTLSQHLLKTLLPRGQTHGTEEKMTALKTLREILREMPVGLAKTAFISDIARHVGADAAEIRAFLREDPVNFLRRDPAREAIREAAQKRSNFGAAQSDQGKSTKDKLNPQEALLAALLMEDGTLAQELDEAVKSKFRSITLRLLFSLNDSENTSHEDALATLDEETAHAVEANRQVVRTTLPQRDDRVKALRDAARKVCLQTIEADLAEVKANLASALDAGADEEDVECLQENHRRLNAQRLEMIRGR